MTRSDGIHLSVVIPAYNEEYRISQPLVEIAHYLKQQSYTHEIICVDDGSTDATHIILEEASSKNSLIRVISYQKNRGKGYAIKQGILAAQGDFILFSDADLNTPMEEVEKLFKILNNADIAIGSRAGRPQARPFLREFGSKFLNLIIRLFAVPGIQDTQCGFKLFRRDAAKRIFSMIILDGFSFDVEVLYLARRLGYKVVEISVIWQYRGGSKVHPIKDGLRFVQDIIRIRRHCYKLGGG